MLTDEAGRNRALRGSARRLAGELRGGDMRTLAALALLIVLAILPAIASASAVEKLRSFNRDVQTARAQFAQTVVDRNGRRVQEASGTLLLSRPGKFRWSYDKPYRQLIVGDGSRVWIHDEDLNQVTVKKMDQALGATPAALLSGAQDIDKGFALADAPAADGLEWLVAKPRGGESSFSEVRIGFSGANPARLELVDSFGQRTSIRLSGLERDPRLPADSFRFTPPKGADVIGDRPL
jgi:outer membrane lipoprotein carrier protein